MTWRDWVEVAMAAALVLAMVLCTVAVLVAIP